LGAILSVQALSMFIEATSGRAPRLRTLLVGFKRPWGVLFVLMTSGLAPFLAGVSYVCLRANWEAATFFFAGAHAHPHAPPHALFLQMKCVMYLAGLPFTFVAPVVVLESPHSYERALARTFVVLIQHLSPALAIVGLSCVFELVTSVIVSGIPAPASVLLALTLAGLYIAYSFALLAVVSLRIWGTPPRRP
jgi:hypothetical protein